MKLHHLGSFAKAHLDSAVCLCVFLCVFCFPLLAYADNEKSRAKTFDEEPRRVAFTDYPEHVAKSFLDALLTKNVYTEPKVNMDPPERGLMYDVWLGNKPVFDARVNELRLTFTPDISKIDPDGKLKLDYRPFDVVFMWDKSSVLVRHSEAAGQTFAGGIRFPKVKKKREKRDWYSYIPGYKSAGIGIFMPQEEVDNQNGLFICPRVNESDLKPPEPSPEPTASGSPLPQQTPGSEDVGHVMLDAPYAISAMRLEMYGFVEGEVISGVSPGYGRAEILASKHLAVSDPYSDEAHGKNPYVTVEYYPKDGSSQDVRVGSDTFAGGLRHVLTLQNGAGYKRSAYFDKAVWVKRLPTTIDLLAEAQGRTMVLKPGDCHLVLVTERFSATYSKEDVPK